jgi:hypothetical protein
MNKEIVQFVNFLDILSTWDIKRGRREVKDFDIFICFNV